MYIHIFVYIINMISKISFVYHVFLFPFFKKKEETYAKGGSGVNKLHIMALKKFLKA